MKHNKYKNVGVIYEALCSAVLKEVSNNNNSKAKKFMSIINKYFLSETTLQKSWQVYHQLLYNETVNYFYADRFINLLVKENNMIDGEKLSIDINNLFSEVSSFANKKELMKTKTPNYKLFASFNMLSENNNLNSTEKISCRTVLSEHLVDNKEADRLRDSYATYKINNNDDIDDTIDETTKRLAEVVAINTFKDRYNNSLNEEQKDFLIHYITKNDGSFNKLIKNKATKIIKDINESVSNDINSETKEKIYLVCEKLKNITSKRRVDEQDLTTILMSLKIKDYTKLF